MTSVLIVEPEVSGHRMQHVRRIGREVVRRGARLMVLTRPGCVDHPSYRVICQELGEALETRLLEGPPLAERWADAGSLVLRQLGYYLMYRRFFRALKPAERPDFVFCPVLDQCDKVMSIFGSPFNGLPWGGLPMLFKFHYGAMGARRGKSPLDGLKKRLLFRLLRDRDLVCVATIDELLYEYLRENQPALASKVFYVGDPADLTGVQSREEARAALGVGQDDVVVLVYGQLEPRKGVDALLEASLDPRFPGNARILLAGRQSHEVKSILAGAAAERLRSTGRLTEIDRYLGDEEEWTVFRAADIVWLGYKNFYGMSGVLVQAASMGLPVVACRLGLLGWMAERHCLGRVVDVDDTSAVAEAVAALASDSDLARSHGERGRKMAAAHTGGVFAGAICDHLGLKSGA